MHATQIPSALTPDELRHLHWDAASLSERLAALELAPREEGGRPAGVDVEPPLLARWRRLLSPEDSGALARRLSWDDLDVPTVARALSISRSAGFASSWTEWVPRVLENASACAVEISEGKTLPEHRASAAEPVPFVDFWAPWLRAARVALAKSMGSVHVRFGAAAIASLERELLDDLSDTGGLLVFEEWKAFRSTRASREAAPYPKFMETMLGPELPRLLRRYPLWARDLARRLETWTARVREMTDRLEADRGALAAEFGASVDEVEGIDPALSDPHDGGRRVCSLRFASGLHLVYKPRDVDLERTFHSLLGWLARLGCPDAPPRLRVVARPGYGWVEHVRQGRFGSAAAVGEFYRRAGSLLCVGFALGARDWHQENVFATAEGPVVVDAEMLLGPSAQRAEGEAHDASDSPSGPLTESCLATGLLGWWNLDAKGRLFEAGGLQPAAPRAGTLPGRRWTGVGTDEVGFVLEETLLPRASNEVLQDALPAPPEAFAEDVVQGFARTYEFLLRHRDLILSPHGPLQDFAGLGTRVLFRPSDQYGAILALLRAPSRQGLGVARSVGLEALNAVFARDHRRPILWPLVEDERSALEGLDVPRFALRTTDTVLESKRGVRVIGHFSRSGLDDARARFGSLGPEDLVRQRALIGAALAAPSSGAAARGDRGEGGSLVAAAEVLGQSLLEQSGDDALVGLPFTTSGDLYRGHVGIALFLSALGAVAGGDAAGRAQLAVRGVVESVKARGPEALVGAGLGACSGLGSLIYGLTWCARLTREKSALELAVELGAGMEPGSIEQEPVHDVEGGVAGLLLALLTLHSATDDGDPRVRMAAEACGRRLVSAQREAEEGAAWPSRDGSMQAGFAHGAAGIACALGRLHAITKDGALARAMLRAHAYERSRFSPGRGNWPYARPDGGTLWLVAWCHGAPGIALGRFLEGSSSGDPDRLADMTAAVHTTGQARPSRHDHLCCGSLGQADVLLTVGRGAGAPDHVQKAREIASAIAQRILAEGWRGVRSTGFEQRTFEPGFFRGLAGVGYQLLRVAHPDRLPSVLGFEATSERSLA